MSTAGMKLMSQKSDARDTTSSFFSFWVLRTRWEGADEVSEGYR